MLLTLLVVISMTGQSLGDLHGLKDRILGINHHGLSIKDPVNSDVTSVSRSVIGKIGNFFNPIVWLRTFVQLIPETAFWLMGVRNYDCRYQTICQTSNYIVHNAPPFMSSMLKYSHESLSTILGDTPYVEAWSIGSIKSIECPLLYNCPKPPFNF